MKKMGWKSGDGLGKEKTGIKEPIRLVQTHDNEGLGYSKMTSDNTWNWLSHQDDFDTLLNKLQEQHLSPSESTSLESQSTVDLEKKSKKSRKRVHYQRAIEGKNLSNRSLADWKCILGVKKKRKCPEEDKPTFGLQEGLLMTSTISSDEYFRSKRIKLAKEENDTVADLRPQSTPEDMYVHKHSDVEQDASSYPKKIKIKKRGRKRRKRNLEQQYVKVLKESDEACSDSAIGSEISGSCDGDQGSVAETASSACSVDDLEVAAEPRTEPEQQVDVVVERERQTETDTVADLGAQNTPEDMSVDKDSDVKQDASSYRMKIKIKKRGRKRRKKNSEQQYIKVLQESDGARPDSAIGSEISGSCDGDQGSVAETLSSTCSADGLELPAEPRTEPEQQVDVVVEGERQTESDEPSEQIQAVQLEKENKCVAEDSLIVLRKIKRKKERKLKLKPISDMTNLEWNSEGNFQAPCPSVTKRVSILKVTGSQTPASSQKKSVRFLQKPSVGFVPAEDSVRGGARFWRKKRTHW